MTRCKACSSSICACSDALERVIRPIVEGQLRSFVSDHPEVLGAVTWFKPSRNLAETFVNSIAKRVVNDLLSASTRGRLMAAMVALPPATPCAIGPAIWGGVDESRGGTATAPAPDAVDWSPFHGAHASDEWRQS